jgi:hypothetical protein
MFRVSPPSSPPVAIMHPVLADPSPAVPSPTINVNRSSSSVVGGGGGGNASKYECCVCTVRELRRTNWKKEKRSEVKRKEERRE